MKVTKLSAFLFAAFTSVAALNRRQTIPAYGPIGAPSVKPFTIISAKPQFRSDAKRTTARWGPFEIPPMKVSYNCFAFENRHEAQARLKGAEQKCDQSWKCEKDCQAINERCQWTSGSQWSRCKPEYSRGHLYELYCSYWTCDSYI